MKIIQINCVYNNGSTGKIAADLNNALRNGGEESIVLYGRMQRSKEPNVKKVCGEFYSHINKALSKITGIMYGGCFFSTNRIINIIKRERPDIVHLQCLNGYFVNIYRLINWLKKSGIKTVLTLHAEFMHTANCGHAFDCEKWKTGCYKCDRFKKETGSILFDKTSKSYKKMKDAFNGFNDNLVITSVSPWLMGRAKESAILGDKNHCVVMNGLDKNVFYHYNDNDLRKKLGLESSKVVFHATPNFNDEKGHNKGGYYILELAKRNPGITFIVAGNYKEKMDIPKNIILLGNISSQQELAKYYSMADLTIIASRRETFSMIVAESLSSGTPAIGFMAGGPESIAIEEFSSFVPYGDINALENKMKEFLDKPIDKEKISKIAIKKYSKEVMCKNFINIYNKLLNK